MHHTFPSPQASSWCSSDGTVAVTNMLPKIHFLCESETVGCAFYSPFSSAYTQCSASSEDALNNPTHGLPGPLIPILFLLHLNAQAPPFSEVCPV